MTIAVLDHGYVSVIEAWGSDQRIVESARMSTQKGFLGWGPVHADDCARARAVAAEAVACTCAPRPGDEKLLRYLYENAHATPFEFAGLVVEVQAPIFVFREWHRHRTQCLAGDTMLHFESPKSDRSGRRFVYKMPLAEVWRKWQPTVRRDRPERQTNALFSRNRIASMRLRCVNEETGEVIETHIRDVARSEPKQLYRVRTLGGKTIRASADHRFFTNLGWLRLEDAVARGALVAVTRTAREMATSWDPPPIDEISERWRDAVGWEGLYEVSDAGRVRRCGREPKRGTVGAQGYPVVSLNRPGIQQLRTVHSLVLEAFVGSRPSGREARHRNHNRLDARAENLEWGTSKDNSGDMVTSDRHQRLVVGYEEILSCDPDRIEVTYDVAVADPWHNFVADGFVVHNSYNEMSARYAPLPDLNYIPTLERCMMGGGHLTRQASAATGAQALTYEAAEMFRAALHLMYEAAESEYQRALAAGLPKELARLVLPVGRYSRMRASANLRNWLGFLTLRMAPTAQWEIRQYADAVGVLIAERFPRTWELFSEAKL